MKRKTYIAAIMTVAVCAAGLVATTTNKTESEKTLDANVEALTDPEMTGAQCGGYREWIIDNNTPKKEFYDCTCTLRSGYEPMGNCN